jgi:hypothetical protein
MMMLASVLLLTVASCNSYLDETPDNRTELDSSTKIAEMLVSAYPTTYFAYLTEMSSDNTDDNGTTYSSASLLQQQAACWQDITETGNDSPTNLWSSCYLAIAAANQALDAIGKSDDPSSLSAQKGEALLCRAYSHFILTNVFCKAYSSTTSATDLGIPYMTTTETTVSPKYDRGSVADDYRAMAADIEAGLPLINDKLYTIPKYHFNKRAANAFAARFYLYYSGHADEVVRYADNVLTDNAASMLRDWSAVGALSPEKSMRAKAFVSADEKANLLLLTASSVWARIYGPYDVGSRYCHNDMIAEYETNRVTNSLWGNEDSLYFKVYRFSTLPKVIMDKMPEYFEYTDAVSGIGYTHVTFPAFTADECLLNRAEAYALKGDYAKAAADIDVFVHAFARSVPTIDINTIDSIYGEYDAAHGRGMQYYTPTRPTPKKKLQPDFSVSSGTQEHLLQAILHLRRVLCLHEGLRWFDIKRYGIEIQRRQVVGGKISVIDTLPKDDPRRALQLPPSVIKAGMTPNPRE